MNPIAITQRFASPTRRWIVVAALAATLVATLGLAVSTGGGNAASAQTPPGITTEDLTPRSEITDDVNALLRIRFEGERHGMVQFLPDMGLTAVVRVTVQPGAAFPWHTHPGVGFFNVAQGETVYQAADCVERSYPTGTTFVDPGRGFVHRLWNPGDEPAVLLVTFFEVPEEGPLVITEGIDEPDCEVGPSVTLHDHP